ncbi:MAG TPA: gluconate 2-dehydrogenase subunit 3 family protein, partial [Deinococcales bacterium]|nr:gluconate 2-dehydrogenase subunit 3 family protein [Deinococcales bacterium]
EPKSDKFFDMLRQDVIEGVFCDPVYGGNRNLAGWKLVGYPGAQRGYTARELQTENAYSRRKPQSIADLPHFHPGQPANRDVTIPVSGFTLQNRP